MDDAKVGAAYRAVRVRTGLTQAGVAKAAGVRQAHVSLLERGSFEHLSFRTVRRVAGVLGMWLELTPRWRGVDLDRLINRAHGALAASVLRWLEGSPGWTVVSEVSYSIYGERGAIDIVAWHAATRTVLIIELKTFLVDPAELVRKMDDRVRLAPRICQDRGWDPKAVGRWIILTDTRTNRRHVTANRELLAPVAQADGRRMRAWLRAPEGPIAGLSFWSEPAAIIKRRVGTARDGVETRRPARP